MTDTAVAVPAGHKRETYSFDVATFQGEKLDPPVSVNGYADIPETKEAAKDVWPNDATILEWLQSDILTRAKSGDRAKALAKHMEAYRESDTFREKDMVRSFRALMGDSAKSLSDAEILERAKALASI